MWVRARCVSSPRNRGALFGFLEFRTRCAAGCPDTFTPEFCSTGSRARQAAQLALELAYNGRKFHPIGDGFAAFLLAAAHNKRHDLRTPLATRKDRCA